jgi:hypothetical protein
MAVFAPLQPVEGYLPLEDYGLIGDGTTAALVGRDGAIPWLCVPRFDSPPVFCGILDAVRGGAFTVAPDDLVASRQFYEPDSGALVTEMRGRAGRAAERGALAPLPVAARTRPPPLRHGTARWPADYPRPGGRRPPPPGPPVGQGGAPPPPSPAGGPAPGDPRRLAAVDAVLPLRGK